MMGKTPLKQRKSSTLLGWWIKINRLIMKIPLKLMTLKCWMRTVRIKLLKMMVKIIKAKIKKFMRILRNQIKIRRKKMAMRSTGKKLARMSKLKWLVTKIINIAARKTSMSLTMNWCPITLRVTIMATFRKVGKKMRKTSNQVERTTWQMTIKLRRLSDQKSWMTDLQFRKSFLKSSLWSMILKMMQGS